MKKIFTLLAVAFCLNGKAQTWVTIPDTNFVTYLQSIIPTAMHHDSLDISNSLVTSTTHSITITNSHVSNLSGIQYFTSLIWLNCEFNSLISLPALPNTLQDLYCSYNSLTSLSTLPNSISSLGCSFNQLASLPTLPNALSDFDCSSNQLTNLPTIPNSLTWLNCSSNQLTSLPVLPNTLQFLFCNSNSLTNLPTLPNPLKKLNCSYNSLTTLTLPNIDSTLQYIACSNNQLTGLPTLPYLLNHLDCMGNNITCFPNFPSSISLPYLNSFGQTAYNIYLTGNPFTCLPNYLPYAMPGSLLAYPLCSAGNSNGCEVAGISSYSNLNTNISIYPNPASTSVQVSLLGNSASSIEIYNAIGECVHQQIATSANCQIDVAALSEGIYTIRIAGNQGVVNKRLVIVK